MSTKVENKEIQSVKSATTQLVFF